MNEPVEPQPRWWHGFPSLFSSGLFALAGVMLAISALLGLVLLTVGKVQASAALPWILVAGALSPLLLYLHSRAERTAGIPGGLSSPTYLPVARDHRRSWPVRLLVGEEQGALTKDGDGLVLRTRFHRQWPLFVAYMPVWFSERPEHWMVAGFYGIFVGDMILALVLRRVERMPRGRLASTLLCGDHVVLFLADAPASEAVVLRIEHFQRNRATALLSSIAPFEELPGPRPPRTPPTPRSPRPPRAMPEPPTAIDASTEKALDRALDGMRKAKS